MFVVQIRSKQMWKRNTAITSLSKLRNSFKAISEFTKHNSKKTELVVHLIFGAGNYTKIKIYKMPRVGRPVESMAELTRFGWVLMSPRKEAKINKVMWRKTCIDYYENLCRLDAWVQQILYVMKVLYIKVSKINLGEERMVGTKLDWYVKKNQMHCKTTNCVVCED